MLFDDYALGQFSSNTAIDSNRLTFRLDFLKDFIKPSRLHLINRQLSHQIFNLFFRHVCAHPLPHLTISRSS